MLERYPLNDRDKALLAAAENLLKKAAAAESTTPAELVSIAKLQHVLSVLPRVTDGLEVSVSVRSPRRKFGDIETWHWWEVRIEEDQLSLSSGGHFYRPSTGGDSFSTMNWSAAPGEPAELCDYSESLRMVPDLRSFADGVASVNFAAGSYSLEVTDSDNDLLEERDEEDEEDEDQDEEDEEEERDWSVTPVDSAEERLASQIDPDEVKDNEAAYSYGAQNCDFCGGDLARCGLYVDGRLRGDVMWGNMCARCFEKRGQGIGWGNGQLYARQPDGKWRMVAGWQRAQDEEGQED